MEEGESSSQRRHEESKSLFNCFSFSDGVENLKKAMDFAEPFMKSESLDVKINRLKRKSDHLKSREEDINAELKYAESLSLKRRRNEVEAWLRHVAHLRDQVHRAEQEVQERIGRIWPEFQLPEKLDRLTAQVEELFRQGVFPHGLTLKPQESRGVIFPTTELAGKTFEYNKNMILNYLRDDNVMSIGIYGMGGVGKTTVLTHVNNELVRNFLGTSAVWVTVSQKFAIHKLQNDIARKLSFSFSCNEDERIRVAELWNFLGMKKNLVLILDDVWEDIPLQEVGVPTCENGCKLILTTRFLEVCRRMDCQEKIKVEPLNEQESWELFRDKLGDDLELTPQIEVIAKALVRECAGLPLGIITMARSMKGEDDLFEWRNALEKMKESRLGYDDMDSKVFQVLKRSYDMLKDPIVQQCFLDCALYPEDFKIMRMDLINLFIDEGLIDGMKSRQAEFDRGHTILNKLVNSCLLETCKREDKPCVKMHDLVRDMALRIANESSPFLVEVGRDVKSFSDKEVWKEDLVKVSLMRNDVHETPFYFGPPKCPNLSTLLLSYCVGLFNINNDFFLHMKGLSVLDLSFTWIVSLPESISELVNLSALLLRGCQKLNYIPSLEKLRALKKLDLYEAAAVPVPHGIGASDKLRYLRCTFNGLESFNTYSKFLQERGPTYYHICLGDFLQHPISQTTDRSVVLRHFEISRREAGFGCFPVLLPKCVEGLFIESSTIEVDNLCDALSFKNVINLRECAIIRCGGIQHLFSNNSSSSSKPLQVEKLYLHNMDELLGLICPSVAFPCVAFSFLKMLDLYNCKSIKRLLTNAWLPNLERMSIFQCYSLVSIGHEEGAEDIPTICTLPKLMELRLRELESLETIQVISDSIQSVRIAMCPKLKRIPLLDREQSSSSLREVFIDHRLRESLEWNNLDAKDYIMSFLEIRNTEDTESEESGEEN